MSVSKHSLRGLNASVKQAGTPYNEVAKYMELETPLKS